MTTISGRSIGSSTIGFDTQPRLSGLRASGWHVHEQAHQELGLSGAGKIRVNQAGCLDRCEEGPVCVVYPEGTWYTYVDETDVDEIIESHLVDGNPVDRLKI